MTLVTLALSLLILTVAGFVESRIEKTARQEIGDQLATVLHATYENLDSWYVWHTNDARAAVMTEGVFPAIEQLLKVYGRSGNLLASAAQKKLRAQMRPFMLSKGYLGYFVISPDGVNLASSRDVNIGVRSLLNDSPGFLSTIFSGTMAVSRPQLSDVPLPDATGKLVPSAPTVFAGVPIFSKEGNRVIAAFAFRIDTRSYFSEIFANWRFGKSGETYAIGADGQLLSESRFNAELRKIGLLPPGVASMLHIYVRDPGGDMTQGFKPEYSRDLLPLTRMARDLVNGGSGSDTKGYRDYRGVKVLGAWLWDGKLNFGIAVEVDAAEALQTLHAQQYMIWGIIFLAIGLMVTLAIFVHRSRTDSEAQAMQTQAILDNAVDGILTIDFQGKFQSFNPAAEKIFGYKAHEIIGEDVSMLMGEAGNETRESEAGGDFFKKLLSTKPGRIVDAGQVVKGKRKDGTLFPMDIAGTQIHVGEKNLYLGTVRDITGRRRAEETLRKSEEGLKNAQRIAHLGSWSWNFVQDEMIWSDEVFRIFGLRPKEFEPTFARFLKITHPQERARVENVIRASRDSKKGFHFEHRILLANGNLRTVQEIAEVVCDDGGDVVRLDATLHDITARKQAEMAKSEFVSTVSHELRTPMTSIHGSLGLLLGGAAGVLDGKKKDLIELAFHSSERLVRLINDILDFEKLEAGRMKFNMVEHALSKLLDQALDANKSYADKFNVILERSPFEEDVFVLVDADRFAQVMANLLSNAVKFSLPGSSIGILVQVRERNVRVSVRDHGPGIPEEFRGKIFQKFTQADSSDTRSKGGTGLGLSITRSIINNMHGMLSFETRMGHGTTFYFDLPLVRRVRAPEFPVSKIGEDMPRILICEDDHAVAIILKELVLDVGVDADIAVTAEQAYQFLCENKYAAMTLDIILPDSDGITLLRKIRKEKNYDDLPIIIVSALRSQDNANLLGDAFGVVDWIDKPLDPLMLKRTIRGVLGRQERTTTVLHVEDDDTIVQRVKKIIGSEVNLLLAKTLAQSRDVLARQSVDLVLLDLTLEDGSGLGLLPDLKRPDGTVIPVLVFSRTEIDQEVIKQVAGVLVKTETTNEELLAEIRGVIKLSQSKGDV